MIVSVDLISCVRNENESDTMEDSFIESVLNLGTSVVFRGITKVISPDSIGSGYLEGIARSDSEIIIFAHSDLEFWCSTRMWNEAIAKAADPETGLVGVAGTSFLSQEGVWWRSGSNTNRGCVNHVHEDMTYSSSFGPYGEVVALDGLLLIARRKLFESVLSWSISPKWNFYDIDICMQAKMAGLRNWVLPLPLLHRSIGLGALEESYEKDRLEFCNKWKDKLPISCMAR